MNIEQILGWLGLAATAFAVIVGGVRALIRGPKEDKDTETEIQDRVTGMAERWLERAEKRLEQAEAKAEAAEARAEAAEQEAKALKPRVSELEHNLFSALDTIGVLWPWGNSGGGEPRPVLPAWIYEWLHSKGVG